MRNHNPRVGGSSPSSATANRRFLRGAKKGLHATCKLPLNLTTPFWEKVAIKGDEDCWEWQGGKDRDGYGTLRCGRALVRAPRVALGLATGREPDHLHALHSCDNPPCCNPAHLRWGTPKENATDKVERGRCKTGNQSGANNGAAKLTEEQVAQIVRMMQAGRSNKQIASEMPVSDSTVSLIRVGKMWRSQTSALGWTPKPQFQRKVSPSRGAAA